MKLDLDTICKHLLEQSMLMWSQEGEVITTTWAIGKKQGLFAQPFDHHGIALPMPARLAMHTVMARAINATWIGQIDEAYTQTRMTAEPEPCEGELADCADTDPSIKTSLCVEAVDLDRGTHRLYAARLELDDEGAPQWDVSVYTRGEGPLVDMFHRVGRYSRELSHASPIGEIVTQMLSLHWTCVEVDTKTVMQEIEYGA